MGAQVYERWYNEETRLVALSIDSDEMRSRYWRAVADETWKLSTEGSNRLDEARDALADRMESELSEAIPQENSGVAKALLRHALGQVVWPVIAAHLLIDLVKESKGRSKVWNGPRPGPETEPKFPLGEVVRTEGASWTIDVRNIQESLARHERGDWGDCCSDDWQANDEALRAGYGLHSVYRSWQGRTFWILTEADRSVTTVLLPGEY